MFEKRRFKRFKIFLKAAGDKGEGEIINVSRFGLMASIVMTDVELRSGDPIVVKISMPNRNETTLCEGVVRHVELKDNVRMIGVEITAMDPSAKSDILELAYKAWGKSTREQLSATQDQ